MKLSPLLKLLLDHYFEIKKLELVIGYSAGTTNNKIEVRKILKQLNVQNPFDTRLVEILQQTLCSSISSKLFPENRSNQTGLKNQMKLIFINKMRNDLMFFQSASFFLSIVLFTDNLYDTAIDSGTSILKVSIMYYLILPILLNYLVRTDLINQYIREKISSYEDLLSSISSKQIEERSEELERDYKHLFFRMNQSENKEIPSLKYLSAFYLKNDTDIDVNGSSIPSEMKQYVHNL